MSPTDLLFIAGLVSLGLGVFRFTRLGRWKPIVLGVALITAGVSVGWTDFSRGFQNGRMAQRQSRSGPVGVPSNR